MSFFTRRTGLPPASGPPAPPPIDNQPLISCCRHLAARTGADPWQRDLVAVGLEFDRVMADPAAATAIHARRRPWPVGAYPATARSAAGRGQFGADRRGCQRDRPDRGHGIARPTWFPGRLAAASPGARAVGRPDVGDSRPRGVPGPHRGRQARNRRPGHRAARGAGRPPGAGLGADRRTRGRGHPADAWGGRPARSALPAGPPGAARPGPGGVPGRADPAADDRPGRRSGHPAGVVLCLRTSLLHPPPLPVGTVRSVAVLRLGDLRGWLAGRTICLVAEPGAGGRRPGPPGSVPGSTGTTWWPGAPPDRSRRPTTAAAPT